MLLCFEESFEQYSQLNTNFFDACKDLLAVQIQSNVIERKDVVLFLWCRFIGKSFIRKHGWVVDEHNNPRLENIY